MEFEGWVKNESKHYKISGYFKSLFTDLFTRRGQFEILESLLLNKPGHTGRFLRYKWYRLFLKTMGKDVVISQGTRLKTPGNIILGDHVNIAQDCFLQAGGGIIIGDCTLIGPGVKIWTVTHLFKDRAKPIKLQGFEAKPVRIGKDCWIGSDVFIKPGAIIPDGCVILPKTIIGKMKIEPFSVVSGSPPKVIGPRNRVGAFLGITKK